MSTSKYRKPKPVAESSTVLELRKDTVALKQLMDLEELVDVPPERGGVYFSEWEDENDDDGPVGVGATYDEALVELEKLLGKALFS